MRLWSSKTFNEQLKSEKNIQKSAIKSVLARWSEGVCVEYRLKEQSTNNNTVYILKSSF